jgi:drug/metabolite transporter (DMT)-like permease
MIPVFVWGISYINTEFLLPVLGPMTIGAIRFLIATILLYVMIKVSGGSLKIDRSDKPLFIVAGAVGIALYFYFENTGILYISANPSSLIMSAIPVLSILLEAVVYKRRIDIVDFVIVALSVVGVAFIVGLDLKTFLHSGKAVGYFMMLGAALSWVIYSLLSKPLYEKYPYLTIIFYQFFYSLPFLLPFMLFEGNKWGRIGFEGLAHLVFLSVFASAVGFYFYAIAVDYLGVTESSMFINFLPIVTIAFNFFYTGQTITLQQFIGGCIVISSVTAASLKQRHGAAAKAVNALK